jgi:hypothetical protein
VTVFALRREPWTALGIGVFLLANPTLASTYGHFDSYTATVATSAAFWLALNAFDRSASWREGFVRGAVTVLLLALAVWTNPINVLLVCVLALYLGVAVVRRYRPALAPDWVLWMGPAVGALGIALALLFKFPDYILHPKVVDGYLPLQGDVVGWFLHSKAMDYLCVALPGCLLFVWLVCCAKNGRPRWNALASGSIFAILAALFCSYTLPFRQGINDEFARCGIGMLTIGPALTLFIAWTEGPQRRAMVSFAILAVFLYVPRIGVYGSSRYIERMRALYPFDRCAHNSQMSSYVHLGLILPMDSAYARQARLAVFAEGAERPLPYWQNHRLLNLLYYTAWCYEFNEDQRGMKGLQALLQSAPGNLPAVLGPGAMFTGRDGHNNAFRKIRRDAKLLLSGSDYGARGGVYAQLKQYIDQLDANTDSR